MKNKKADFAYNWVEYLFIVLLIIGFILALKVGSAVMAYIIISLCGLMSGRIFYRIRNKPQFTFYVIIIGFLLGYLLGSYYGNKKLILMFFVLFNIISYFIYKKGYIK